MAYDNVEKFVKFSEDIMFYKIAKQTNYMATVVS